MIFGKTLKDLEEKIEAFTKFCEDKNLKLKPSKMVISEEVEFAGTVVKAATVENEDIVFIQPRNKRIKAFLELKKPSTKKEIQIWSGMLSSLQKWFPSLPLNLSRLRKLTKGKGKITWD